MVYKLGRSQRRVCRALKQPRSTQRYQPTIRELDVKLAREIHSIAMENQRWGYRKVYDKLRLDCWRINVKRVHRHWKQMGLQVRQKPRKKKLKRDSNNAYHRFKPLCLNHVWSYDFVTDRTDHGRRIRFLNVVDEFTRECLTIEVRRHYTGKDVVNTLAKLFAIRGRPDF